ncbi:MAG: hypothetical protein A2857_00410 [Candidatus Levybacteria bacterium RIFCSPHIGHO2_01_FULL_36_15]|nr:MAG: hypothetical protein A2857_00410 [Candidatus Levybacteria bacterium RIFCSPHIGHO2_01_FULL_36_15]
MKIGIDARLINQSGIGRYTRNLIKHLQAMDKKNEYVLFVLERDYENLKSKISNLRSQIVRTNTHWHSIDEQIKFPSIINHENLDLMHFSYFSVPVFYKKPYIVTIHDLIIDHFPTGKASSLPLAIYYFKRMAYKFVTAKVTSDAKKIIVPSNATKDELIQHYKVPKEKINVIYEGIFDDSDAGESAEKIDVKDYFLYVGNAYPHKNLEKLIEAFIMFIRKKDKYPSLVLAGRKDYFYDKLKDFVKKYGETGKHIIFMGEVSDSELKSLYRNARALVTASQMEGFGLTALEAMSLKCVVLSSDIASLHEICQDCCIYFDPNDIVDIKKKLDMLYNLEQKKLDDLKQKGFERSKNFSWDKMAVETIKIYESSVGI